MEGSEFTIESRTAGPLQVRHVATDSRLRTVESYLNGGKWRQRQRQGTRARAHRTLVVAQSQAPIELPDREQNEGDGFHGCLGALVRQHLELRDAMIARSIRHERLLRSDGNYADSMRVAFCCII
jgi:hypothetical protein